MGLLGTTLDDVKRTIERWKPGSLRSEVEYRNDLARVLQEKFTDAEITKEYGRGRLRADLHIKFAGGVRRFWDGTNECFVEMKHGFQSRAKLQRLMGQITQYAKQEMLPCFVVLCGDSDAQSLKELQGFVQEHNDKSSFGEARDYVLVITKPTLTKAPDAERPRESPRRDHR